MAITYNIEELIEDAYITLIAANTYVIANNIPVRKWRDATNNKAYPVIVVHCDDMGADDVFTNIVIADPALVSISAMTHVVKDKSSVIVNTLKSEIRSIISSDTIAADLNTAQAGLKVYDKGVTNGTGSTDDSSTIRRRDLNQEVRATVVDVP